MPLHTKPEWPFWILDGLDGAVGSASRHLETGMGDHRLMVVAADLHTITDERSHSGAFSCRDGRPAEGVSAGCMLLMAHNIGQILFQRASGPNGHHLHTPADTKRRQSNSISGVEQPKLPGVPIATHFGRRMWHLAVALRIHIRAARDDQPIQPRDHLSRTIGLWWQHYDHTAGSLN